MSVRMDDTGELDGAPRPIDMDSVAEGTFERLGKGEGAVSPRRTPSPIGGVKEEEPVISKRMVIGFVVAAVLAVILIVALIIHALNRPVPNSEVVQEEQPPTIEQTEATVDDGISYRGHVYAIEKSGSKYELVSMPEGEEGAQGDQKSSLGELDGEPVGIVLFDATLIIPQNLSGGTWNVVAYTIGSGWSSVNDVNGNAQAGQGVISESHLEGTTLQLVVDGSQVDIPLVW